MTRSPLLLTVSFGIALFVLSTVSTPRIEGDGQYYAYASQTLLEGRGLLYHPDGGINLERHAIEQGGRMALWSPGYPMLLAFGQWVGFSVTQTASLINAVSMALIAGLMLLLLQDAPFWFQIASILWIWQGDFMQRQAQFVYADLLFLALWMCLIYLLIHHKTRLFALVLLGMALPIVRYVGVIAIPAGALCLMLWGQGRVQARAFNAGLFALASCIPIGLWFVRNLHYGSLMGERLSTGRPLPDVLGSFAGIHVQWMIEGTFVYAAVWGVQYFLFPVQRNHPVQQSGNHNQLRGSASLAPVSSDIDDDRGEA